MIKLQSSTTFFASSAFLSFLSRVIGRGIRYLQTDLMPVFAGRVTANYSSRRSLRVNRASPLENASHGGGQRYGKPLAHASFPRGRPVERSARSRLFVCVSVPVNHQYYYRRVLFFSAAKQPKRQGRSKRDSLFVMPKCDARREHCFLNNIYSVLYTGWAEIRSTTDQGLVLRQKFGTFFIWV